MKEIRDVPDNRLEEVYQLVHSLTPKAKPTETLLKKILSFWGAFSDMSNEDYVDYLEQTKQLRTI